MSRAGDIDTRPLELTLPAEPESVRAARCAAEDYALARGADAEAVKVAVSEVVSNAVLHGFRNGVRGQVSVDARCRDGELVVVVSDDGNGIAPDPESKGLGFGLPLVAALSDEIAISTSASGGTRIQMRFGAGG